MTFQYSNDKINWYEKDNGHIYIRSIDGKDIHTSFVTEITLSNGEKHRGIMIDNYFWSEGFGGMVTTKI